jgi:chromate transporter
MASRRKAMSDAKPADLAAAPSAPQNVSLGQVFWQFFIIGATSFGGPIPYLRRQLVDKLHWLDDKQFVEMLSISQSLPGLNATNMAILLGDRLRGPWGSAAAIIAICLPGGLYMFGVGIFYRLHGDHGWVTSALKGIAAASIGLTLATVMQLSKRSLSQHFDLLFIALTVLAVNRLHFSVLETLLAVGLMATLWHRPRSNSVITPGEATAALKDGQP